jgi:hypothetical protein
MQTRLMTTHEKLETTDDKSGPISEIWNRSSHRRRSIVTSASTDSPGPMTHINGPRTTSTIRVATTVVRSFHTSPEMLCSVASNIFSIITKLYPLHTRICITSAPCRRHQVQAAQVSTRIVGPQYELASYHPSGAKNFRKICEPLHQSADHKWLTRKLNNSSTTKCSDRHRYPEGIRMLRAHH